MKKAIYIIINIIISIHTLFGLLGFFVMLSDLFDMVLFALWTASGIAMLCIAHIIYKSLANPPREKVSSISSNLAPSVNPAPSSDTAASVPSDNVSDSIPDDVPSPVLTSSESPASNTSPVSEADETVFPSHGDEPPSSLKELSSPTVPQDPLAFPDVYLVLDVETPNRKNDRISQIGLLLVKNGQIQKNYSTLINPEAAFDPINISITGLDSHKVSRAPIFADFWPRVSDLFDNYVVVIHNADFDLNVLNKTILHYGYNFPQIQYVCTYVESMNKFPELSSHKLTDISAHLGINVDIPHNASHDADITMRVFEKMKALHFDFSVSYFKDKQDCIVSECDTSLQDFTESSSPVEKNDDIDYGYEQDDLIIEIPFSDLSEIPIEGKRFVFTGVFSLVDRNDIRAYIETHGGRVIASVSSATDFLNVGTEREPAWKHGNYGKKIEKAIELIQNGKGRVKIVKEQSFIELCNL